MTQRSTPKMVALAQLFRSKPSSIEKVVWKKLESRGKGYKFQRQYPIYGIIVDFYCAKLKLIIDIHQPFHVIFKGTSFDHDFFDMKMERLKDLERKGYTVLRFRVAEVERDFDRRVDEAVSLLKPITA